MVISAGYGGISAPNGAKLDSRGAERAKVSIKSTTFSMIYSIFNYEIHHFQHDLAHLSCWSEVGLFWRRGFSAST